MKKAKKGFTLVELMVVIVIMAVLAAAATPVFAGYVKKARAAEHLSECRAIYVAAQSCLEEAFLKAGEGTVTVEDLDMERKVSEGCGGAFRCWRNRVRRGNAGERRLCRNLFHLPGKRKGRSRLYGGRLSW